MVKYQIANSFLRVHEGGMLHSIFTALGEEGVFCNHYQAWRLYVKALMKPNEYLAVKCDSHGDYKKGRCDGNNKTYVGIDVDTTARGNYYIDTGVTAVDV